jgi:hypothetical protein
MLAVRTERNWPARSFGAVLQIRSRWHREVRRLQEHNWRQTLRKSRVQDSDSQMALNERLAGFVCGRPAAGVAGRMNRLNMPMQQIRTIRRAEWRCAVCSNAGLFVAVPAGYASDGRAAAGAAVSRPSGHILRRRCVDTLNGSGVSTRLRTVDVMHVRLLAGTADGTVSWPCGFFVR